MNTQILTANDLRTGRVVYFNSKGEWTGFITEAQLARDELAAERLLTKGQLAEQAQLVVGAYLIEVDGQYEVPIPVRYREQLRVNGPSIHQSFAKSHHNTLAE